MGRLAPCTPLRVLVLVAFVAVSCWSSPDVVPDGVDVPSPSATLRSDPVPPAPSPPSPSPTRPSVVIEPVDAPWTRELDPIVDVAGVSVAVGVGDRIVFAHAGERDRIPASGQKLLTSMAVLDAFGSDHRFPTVAAATTEPRNGVLHGDLWLVGSGDPEVGPERLRVLAAALRRAGVRRVTGDVLGDTGALSRRWWAPGWVEGLSRSYVARPTALTFAGNAGTQPPELAAAASFAAARAPGGGVVEGHPATGDAPGDLHRVASVRSAPLAELLARQNANSLNLHAEILLRALGDRTSGAGTTAAGADAVEAWAGDRGVDVRARDGSGLSHGDAASADDLVTLLLLAAREPWGLALERSLATPGSGTLEGRLAGVPARAKTGTLFTVPCSTLAGYVRDADGNRVAFAVLSEGLSKATSIAIEDAVVRTLASHAIT